MQNSESKYMQKFQKNYANIVKICKIAENMPKISKNMQKL